MKKQQLVPYKKIENTEKQIKENEKQQAFKLDELTKEERIIKKESKKFWKFLFFTLLFVLLFFTVACLIEIFSFVKGFFNDITLGNIVGGLVVGLLSLLIIIFVIRPIIVALSSPMFTLKVIKYEENDKISHANFKRMQKVASNIIKTNDNVSKENKNLLQSFMHNRVELNKTLKKIYKTEIHKDITRLIMDTSSKVMLTTAVSQSEKIDALSVGLLNVRMIMQICVRCGYHPSYARLTKLIIRVFTNAILAYSIQAFNLEDLVVKSVDKLTKGLLSSIPMLNEIAKGVTQGAANALLTLRIGFITRKYLYEEYSMQEKITSKDQIQQEIVTDALKESNDSIDEVVKEFKKNIMITKKEK